jgi:hypothetical protein
MKLEFYVNEQMQIPTADGKKLKLYSLAVTVGPPPPPPETTQGTVTMDLPLLDEVPDQSVIPVEGQKFFLTFSEPPDGPR